MKPRIFPALALACLLQAGAHPAPALELACSFRDPQGLPVSGLTAAIDRGGHRVEAEIRHGRAVLLLPHLEADSGPARLRAYDPWRRPVLFRDGAGHLQAEIPFRFQPPDSAWTFPGQAGRLAPAPLPGPAAVVAWSADTVAPALREDLARAEAVDRAIALDLEKRLAELRRKAGRP